MGRGELILAEDEREAFLEQARERFARGTDAFELQARGIVDAGLINQAQAPDDVRDRRAQVVTEERQATGVEGRRGRDRNVIGHGARPWVTVEGRQTKAQAQVAWSQVIRDFRPGSNLSETSMH